MKATAIKHVGIVSADAEKTANWFVEMLGAEIVRKAPAPDWGMEATYISMGEEQIEIQEPTGEGVIKKFMETHGGGMHHISIAVDDIDALETYLESKDVRLIGKGIVDGHKGFFIHPKACGILIEAFQYNYVKEN